MREIKFRVWHAGKMDYDPYLCGRNNTAQLNQLSALNEHVFMQFTGLKDKNGKEIYEGDIVQSPRFTSLSTDYGMWEVQIRDLEDGVVLLNDAKKQGSIEYEDGEYSLTECEVIGNVYENAELLAPVEKEHPQYGKDCPECGGWEHNHKANCAAVE
jgi:uncharacterized phage protein (TIGR01671 family)